MALVLRCLRDNRHLWRAWLPLLVLALVAPLAAIAMPLVERWVIDDVVVARRLELLPRMLAMYAALWLATTSCHTLAGILRVYLGERLTMALRLRLLAQCGELSLAFSRREHSGRTMSLFTNDVPLVAGLFSTTTVGVVSSVVTLIVGAVAMFSLSWQLAIAAVLVPPLLAGAAAVLTRPLRPASRRAQEKAAELSERLQENLTGLREVVAFGRERAQRLRFGGTLRDLQRLRVRITLMESGLQFGQSVFSLAITAVILGYGAYLVVQDQTTLGTVVAMRSLFGYVIVPATMVLGLVSDVQKSLAGAERVYGFLDQVPPVPERISAVSPTVVTGEIAFEGVTFAYQPGHPVLTDVSFTARAGETIAVVGPSGAGKSTLASLVARFYDPIAGRVTLDGTDLRDLTLEGLRRHVAIVFQDTFLFAATIRENLEIGREGASEAEMIAACQAANAWEFVERLPAGLDTPVGERGARLSEGQRQRLALARAFLRDPRILILDEPTAALDARSEHLLQTALRKLVQGRTTLVIAHRLATVEGADRILVLDRGRIAQEGPHADLLRRGGLYRELYELQLGGRIAGDGLLVARRPLETAYV